LIAVNAREILTLLFSPEFAPAATLLAILGFAQGVCMTSFNTLLSVMTGGRQAGTASRLTIALVPVALIASLLGVLFFGAIGAAVASLISCGAAVIGTGVLLWREHGPYVRIGTAARIVGLTLCLAAVSAYIDTSGVWLLVEAVVLGIAYLAALPALGIVGPSDLELLRAGKKATSPGQVAVEAAGS
jgi:O-antigen/teichoic acid export membrane protein